MPTIEIFERSRAPTDAQASDPTGLFAREQFEAALHWLESGTVVVERHAIAVNGPLVLDNSTVKTAIELQGDDALPITVLDGKIISIGGYPTHAELLTAAGYRPSDDPEFLREVDALAAGMSAALTTNDFAQFLYAYERARMLGISTEALQKTVQSAECTAGTSIRVETITKLEQFLARGPGGNPTGGCCACAGDFAYLSTSSRSICSRVFPFVSGSLSQIKTQPRQQIPA